MLPISGDVFKQLALFFQQPPEHAFGDAIEAGGAAEPFVVARCHKGYYRGTMPKNSTKKNSDAGAAVLAWYDEHRRILPWRANPNALADPYHVLLSEVMLQQTVVETVKPYYAAFLARFPRLEHLASASQDEVLRLWAGLGYYARGRNLHRAAVVLMRDYGGVFPDDEAELRKLPGVGAYTAAALVAFAFGKRALVMDANIERIIARFGGIETPLPAARSELRVVLDALTPAVRAGDFAQALMDIGNAICTPPRKKAGGKKKGAVSQPQCALCPLGAWCVGRHGDPASLPRKAPKSPRPTREGVVMVVRDESGEVLLVRRSPRNSRGGGLLGGMVMFPTSDWADGSRQQRHYPIAPDSLLARLTKHPSRQKLEAKVKHIFTHFTLYLEVEVVRVQRQELSDLDADAFWLPWGQLDDEALPSVMVKVAALVAPVPSGENGASP